MSGADIIIAALGQPNFVKAEMVKEGAVVIDVGTTPCAGCHKEIRIQTDRRCEI